MSELISEYIQDERKATVLKDGDGYIVKMYQGELLKETRPIMGHTESYAEEAAENWVVGVIR